MSKRRTDVITDLYESNALYDVEGYGLDGRVPEVIRMLMEMLHVLAESGLDPATRARLRVGLRWCEIVLDDKHVDWPGRYTRLPAAAELPGLRDHPDYGTLVAVTLDDVNPHGF
jgi:hypothetical protein